MSKKRTKILHDDDLLTIGEFARMADMTAPQLRNYDDLGILKPIKRGSENNANYRYYSLRQVPVARMIKVLRMLDISLSEIAIFGNERDPGSVSKLFKRYGTGLSTEINLLQEVHSYIDIKQELMFEGMNIDEDEISIYEMPEKRITIGEQTAFIEGESYHNEFQKFRMTPRSPRLNLLYPVGGYFDSFGSFFKTPSRPDRFFSLNPNGEQKKERGVYMVGYTRGYYGVTNDLPERMAEYAKKNKITFDGPVYNIYLFDEICMPDADQYLLQVSALIKASDIKIPHRLSKKYAVLRK